MAVLQIGQALAEDDVNLAYSRATLQSEEGRQLLHAQIIELAKDHCPTYAQVRELPERSRCVGEVVTQLVSAVGDADFTRYMASDPKLPDTLARGPREVPDGMQAIRE